MANYFNEDYIHPLVVEYQSADDVRRQEILRLIYPQTLKLINGIIFTHKFHVYSPVDDLQQVAVEAIIKSIDKFNPQYITKKGSKVTIFNYMSLTAKNSMKYYTLRDKDHRVNVKMDAFENSQDWFLTDEDNDTILEKQSFIQRLRYIVDDIESHHSQTKRRDGLIVREMITYIKERGDYDKRDFFRWCKFKGLSPNMIRKGIERLKEYRGVFTND